MNRIWYTLLVAVLLGANVPNAHANYIIDDPAGHISNKDIFSLSAGETCTKAQGDKVRARMADAELWAQTGRDYYTSKTSMTNSIDRPNYLGMLKVVFGLTDFDNMSVPADGLGTNLRLLYTVFNDSSKTVLITCSDNFDKVVVAPCAFDADTIAGTAPGEWFGFNTSVTVVMLCGNRFFDLSESANPEGNTFTQAHTLLHEMTHAASIMKYGVITFADGVGMWDRIRKGDPANPNKMVQIYGFSDVLKAAANPKYQDGRMVYVTEAIVWWCRMMAVIEQTRKTKLPEETGCAESDKEAKQLGHDQPQKPTEATDGGVAGVDDDVEDQPCSGGTSGMTSPYTGALVSNCSVGGTPTASMSFLMLIGLAILIARRRRSA